MIIGMKYNIRLSYKPNLLLSSLFFILSMTNFIRAYLFKNSYFI